MFFIGLGTGIAFSVFTALWFRAFYDAKLINKAREESYRECTEWSHKFPGTPPPPPNVR